MRHKRELMWWTAICVAAVGLSTLVGGFLGPIVALFALVLLAGAILIEFEGPQAGSAVQDYLDDDAGQTTDPEAAAPAEAIPVDDHPDGELQPLDEPVAPAAAENSPDAEDSPDTAEDADTEGTADTEASAAERAEEIEHRATASA